MAVFDYRQKNDNYRLADSDSIVGTLKLPEDLKDVTPADTIKVTPLKRGVLLAGKVILALVKTPTFTGELHADVKLNDVTLGQVTLDSANRLVEVDIPLANRLVEEWGGSINLAITQNTLTADFGELKVVTAHTELHEINGDFVPYQ